MGRILGRVEYRETELVRYFIHDDTSGWSMPPLFINSAEAWDAYDSGEGKALRETVPKQSTHVRVIRKVLAHGLIFAVSGETYGEAVFGLATDDRLLYPLSTGGEEAPMCFLKSAGIFHVAEELDGGFDGFYDHPLCADRWQWSENDERIAFEELHGKPLDLCPRCVEVLMTKR
ncbi:hypothetical protein, partial [Pandoraea sp. ISTKB]|uniref:hypothetical protein n=1 Tax=Pandoraea sp. ISTKB TaxID=1586708 RepID=UPI001112F9AB